MEYQVIKRKGHKEAFDERKVYASAYSAALNCHYTEMDAERVADTVTGKIVQWLKDKREVTSHQLREHILIELDALDSDVALMYRHHLDVC